MMSVRSDRDAFKAVGELDLKGIPEPVEAYEIEWKPLGTEVELYRFPLPHRSGIAYVGRVFERECSARSGSRPKPAPATRC